MKKKDKLLKILFDMYEEAYQNSIPKASFYELYENAPIDKDGRKVIDFKAYECEEVILKEILDKRLNDKKLRLSEFEKRSLQFQYWLGCSPKTKNFNPN